MKLIEIDNNCEEGCGYVRVLSPGDRLLAMRARQAASGGRNIPGHLDIICSNCMIEKITDAYWAEKMKRIIAG